MTPTVHLSSPPNTKHAHSSLLKDGVQFTLPLRPSAPPADAAGAAAAAAAADLVPVRAYLAAARAAPFSIDAAGAAFLERGA